MCLTGSSYCASELNLWHPSSEFLLWVPLCKQRSMSELPNLSSITPSTAPLRWVKSTQFFHLDKEAYSVCSCFPPLYLCLNFHYSSTYVSQSHYVRVTPHFQFPWYLIISCHSSYLVRMNQMSSYVGSSFCMYGFICQCFWKTVKYLSLGTMC